MLNASKRIILLTFLFVFIFPKMSFGANFGVRPAYPREDNPRTDSIFVQTIPPGESKKEGVKVINSTQEPKNLLLYARDSMKSSGGGFACIQLLEKNKDVGDWIKFDLSELEEDLSEIKFGQSTNTIEITIPSGAEIIIPFTINIPIGASVGEHNGCVLVQEIKEKTEEVGVSLSLRSGLRVAITVPGEVIRKIEFSDFELEKKNNSVYLRPSVKNTGNVSIDTDVSVKVKYFFGLTHRDFGGEFPVLRDETYDFNFELKRPFWGGLYSATAVFSYDNGSKASIGVESGEKLEKVKSDTKWFFTAPTIFGLIIEIGILLIMLVIFAIWRLNKKKKRWIKKWVPYTVKEGDTLQKISKQNRVHWEIIVEVNKIKPPYILEEGDMVRIPPQKRSLENPK